MAPPPGAAPPATLPAQLTAPAAAAGYATLGMLDGTVIARLECDARPGAAVLGRGSLSTIRLQDPFVHRFHAEICWDDSARAHVITHGDGANGTFVNMQRIEQPTRLIDGSRIRIGKTELIYRRGWG
jgi:hypothetical protein